MAIVIPRQEHIAPTHDGDPLYLYYTSYAGWFFRRRFEMAVRLMRPQGYAWLLEAGCGSGIFLKELNRHCQRLDAIDVHDGLDSVRQMIRQEGLSPDKVHVRQGSIFKIPYGDEVFDGVICMSVLEHFADPGPALTELARVATPNADIILGFPAKNWITDLMFRLTGYDPHEIHPSSHTTIVKAARERFVLEAIERFPATGPAWYVTCLCRKTPVR